MILQLRPLDEKRMQFLWLFNTLRHLPLYNVEISLRAKMLTTVNVFFSYVDTSDKVLI